MFIDAESLDAKSAYKLLIGSVIPRPIAWVSTESTDGIGNLAPISFFTVAGRKPPRISLSIQPRSDGVTLKDSFVNMRDTGEFVTHLATLPQVLPLHISASEFEPDEDEFDAIGLKKLPSLAVKPPRIEGAPIAFECVVDRIVPAPDGLNHMVIGRVVQFYIRTTSTCPAGGSTPVRWRPSAVWPPNTRWWTTPSCHHWTAKPSHTSPAAGCDGSTRTTRTTR
ncbi:flavin reductase family protein [Arthrobacter sp. ISL-72]|uniref:flavin reductase family protein n=1 Tax=Arthrobacter sp. ISL-72 TaxID=2819114 RepID=UPI001BE9F646|nr:flavin reductase family protein [Arthrobacter sp. ISL-72]MBT2597471.1 flavin reductase family protein [Arthrobacter sp. ISL-72]